MIPFPHCHFKSPLVISLLLISLGRQGYGDRSSRIQSHEIWSNPAKPALTSSLKLGQLGHVDGTSGLPTSSSVAMIQVLQRLGQDRRTVGNPTASPTRAYGSHQDLLPSYIPLLFLTCNLIQTLLSLFGHILSSVWAGRGHCRHTLGEGTAIPTTRNPSSKVHKLLVDLFSRLKYSICDRKCLY